MMQPQKILLTVLFVFLTFPVALWGLHMPADQTGWFYVYYLSKLGALMGMVLFLIQFVLGTKLRFIETFFGHDKMIGLHRVTGITAFALVLFHALAVITMRSAAFARSINSVYSWERWLSF